MSSQSLLSSGPDLANLAVNLEPVHHAWASIIGPGREVNLNDQGSRIKVKVTSVPHNLTVLTFATPSISTSNQELVSWTLFKDIVPHFEFLCSPSNSSFSIDKGVVDLFASALDLLEQLKNQYVNSRPLIITGHSHGGSIASLFTLWLLHSSNASTTKSPICITFGSPLIGDNNFQKAISTYPAWHSSFLHVVSDKDHVLSISHPDYKPFGTFLFCSESGCASFDDSESVSLMLALMKESLGNQGLHEVNYGSILKNLKSKVLVKGASDLVQIADTLRAEIADTLRAEIADTLRAEIAMQLQTIGISGELKSIADMADCAKEAIIQRRDFFDPSKRLNNVKINMARLEWYKKETKKDKIGYYNSYKNGHDVKKTTDVKGYKTGLTKYWEKMVEEVEKKPQKEGAAFRIRWIFAGTNYRRMVEPLDIAEFYQSDRQESYLESRPKHYRLLEEWHVLEERNRDQGYDRKEPIGMTDDSCFWVHVEEAMKSCKRLNSGNLSDEQKQAATQSLHDFEEYLMGLIKAYAVSSEVFLEGSSLMKWWNEYGKINGTRYSEFVDFMKNRRRYGKYA